MTVRPLRLHVKGFTAFRDEQVLDFAELDVFAIAGPTGLRQVVACSTP